MTVAAIPVSPAWLDLREPADAAARSRELVSHLRPLLPTGGRLVIHDLGCGSGAMGRWLAPLVPGPQRWILHDRDPDLLTLAEADRPGPAADGSLVAAETRLSDVTRLGPGRAGRRRSHHGLGAARPADGGRAGRADARVLRSRVPGAAHALGHRSRPADPAGPARLAGRGRVRCAPAPCDTARPPARPGSRRGRRRRVRPAGGEGHRPAEPVAPRRRRDGADRRVARRLGRAPRASRTPRCSPPPRGIDVAA